MYTFEEITGNNQIIKNLQSAILNNKVSHAYIINGGDGMGKKLIAKSFAKTLQCIKGGASACDNCVACKVFDSDNNPDIHYVVPSKTKSIGVDDIREQVGKNIEVKQYKYKYKIFIIDKADTMTVQAQNALLKTLEEPPEYAVFLLLASNVDYFLPTILSRCVVLKLRPLPLASIMNYLKETGINEEQASVFGEYSQGSIGRAIKISSSDEFAKMREDIISWLISISNKDIVSVMSMAKDFEIYKEKQEMTDIIYMWYRDLLAMKRLDNSKYLIQKDKKNELLKQSERESFEGLSKKIEAVWQAKKQLGQNSNFQLTMEVMLIKLKES